MLSAMLQVRYMYGRVQLWREGPLSTMLTHISPGVYRRLAHAVVHLSVVHGTSRCSAADAI